jgi:hypothetical protein
MVTQSTIFSIIIFDYQVVIINITIISYDIMMYHFYVCTQRTSFTHIRGCRGDSNQYSPCKGNNLITRHTWTTKVSRVATFRIDYQRVELGPPYPNAVFHVKTSTGSPWVAWTLSQCHLWSTVGCRATQRPSTLLSLWDPINPIWVSTQLNACYNRAQPTRSLIDTGGGYPLGAPNLTSGNSHPSHPVFPTFP